MSNAYFLLSHDLLRQLLCLPEDSIISAVHFENPHTCRVWISHSDIEIKEGQLMEVMPTFKTENGETILEHW